MTNRLFRSNSPYLLQHADNPVFWQMWDDEAFTAAARQEKPVFLSIGYSTCHWCHVMAHESFEDDKVAELLNRSFVSIKVDREERPDIDAHYMDAAVMMTGSGGWPLTLLLTPDRKPFFAATYIPKERLIGLLEQVEKLWNEEREKVTASAGNIQKSLKEYAESASPGDVPDSDFLRSAAASAYNNLRQRFDRINGGFSQAPKFPQPHLLLFLLRYYHAAGEKNALDMAEKTLLHMRAGGVYDQIGFGFHRYSTDSVWKVPHFEKMLYDQAMTLLAYTEAWQLTGRELWKKTAEEICEFVLRDMTSPEGGFYSALDADSDGGEGFHYLWDCREIRHLFPEKSSLVINFFSMNEEGNFADPHHGGTTGLNVPFLDPSRLEKGNDEQQLLLHSDEYRQIREKLFNRRVTRTFPGLDDKILTGWNGLMIYALARAGRVLEREDIIAAAERGADFILDTLKTETGRLLRCYRNGEASVPGQLGDYAFMTAALLELYRTGFDVGRLSTALSLTDIVVKNFTDPENGGFFTTSPDQSDLPFRKKESADNVIPSGTSMMAENLIRLYQLTGEKRYLDHCESAAASISRDLQRYPGQSAMFMAAAGYFYSEGQEIVVAGDTSSAAVREAERSMLRTINLHYLPWAVVLLKRKENSGQLESLAPYTAAYPADGETAVYVCTGFSCKKPVSSERELSELLLKS